MGVQVLCCSQIMASEISNSSARLMGHSESCLATWNLWEGNMDMDPFYHDVDRLPFQESPETLEPPSRTSGAYLGAFGIV